jgi:ketosteroid isomerase-like protein
MTADEVMQRYAAAWARGDPEAAFAFYADDVVMHLPGRSAVAGDHHGKSAVVDAIRALLERTDGLPVTVEVLDRLVSANAVALVLREVATRGDETLDLRRVNVYRVHDGLITDIAIFEADQYEVDAFFGVD